MHVVLTVVSGPRTGVRSRLPDKTAITIGRSKTTDFHILDPTLSRVHAVIARDEQGWYVEDQKSRNGTFIGEERVDRARLRAGDLIVFGGTSGIRFELEEDDFATSAAKFELPECAACGHAIRGAAELVRNPDGRPFHTACRNLDFLIGSDLGEFRIDGVAPRLGDGFCFSAHQPSLQRTVMLEVYDPPLTSLPGFRAALLEEVRRASGFVHPAILQIFAFGEARGMCFVVMESFGGERLARVLEQRRFVKIRGAVRAAEHIAEALRYAVASGASVPWIAPDRVLVLDEQDAKVKFFETPRPGVRRAATAAEAPYVAPESLVGDAGGGRDESRLVYSVGAILYHMLAGIPPFEGDTPQAVARRALSESPPALRRINLKVSPALARAVEEAIDRDPSRRPRDLAALISRLRDPS